MIYLDNSATTFPKPDCVYEALDFANRQLAFNAGRSSYKQALNSIEIIENARIEIASFISCSPLNVVFLSSATEALNLIINGLGIEEGDNIYISPFEHNAVVRPLYNLKENIDFNIILIPFDKKTWMLEDKKLINMFALNNPKAVFLSQISNVTGFTLPYSEIFGFSKKYRCLNVLDAAQSYGILNPDKYCIDFIVFAGHKSLYASFGVAGFINLSDTELNIVKSGGNGSDSLNQGMPKHGHGRYESGSPNVVAIYGLLKSSQWLKKQNIAKEEKEMTIYLINKLRESNKVKIYIPDIKYIFGTVSINVEGYRPEEVGMILSDEFGICVRTGYHCSPFVHDFIDTKDMGGTTRISLGAFNTEKDIDALIEALNTL